jgi:hypothetical protein
VEDLIKMGYGPIDVAEIAFAVVGSCFTNRFATFVASPLMEQETVEEGFMARWVRPAIIRLKLRNYPRPLVLEDLPTEEGPYDALIDLVKGTQGAPVLSRMLRGAMGSKVLPRRTVGWMFAVIATTLNCDLCTKGSRDLLVGEGIKEDRIDAVLQSLAGPELDSTEATLLPWVRETVHYETEVIQRRTRELTTKLEPRVVLEAIGVASLANGLCRMAATVCEDPA